METQIKIVELQRHQDIINLNNWLIGKHIIEIKPMYEGQELLIIYKITIPKKLKKDPIDILIKEIHGK